MRLDDQRESEQIEDRRGQGGGGFGGGGGRLPFGLAGGGLGTVAIIVVALLLGVNPMQLLGMLEGGAPPQQAQHAPPPHAGPAASDDVQRRFVAQVLATTEEAWSGLFQQNGRTYERPVLVLFSGATQSGCGAAQSATGPFYCPADQKVYLDMSFFTDMERRLGAPGEFARAYVIAHEVGHHVQRLLGIERRVSEQRRRAGEAEGNVLSVRLELQADCFAGVWAHQTQRRLDRADIESGLGAAAAIGDDRLQMRARGYVVPESFTHGSSAQRVHWFQAGLNSGDIRQCDTFAAGSL